MAQILNLLGQRFGRLTVIARAPNTADGRAVWECRCDCGSTKVVTAKMLRDGKTSSCGCYRRERQSKVRRRELKGMRFGMLEVVKEMGLNRHGYYTWLCKCDCGRFKTISSGQLLNRQRPTKSCGCLIGKTSTERTLKDMIGKRCHRLVGIKRVPSLNKTSARWLFQCDCGNTTEAEGAAVRSGEIKSCGCLKTETSRAWGQKIWKEHLKTEGIMAYLHDQAYAERPSYVYLVRVADYYLKYGIAFNVQARGMGDYQEVLYSRRLPRAACWAVEQLALRETARWATTNAPTSLRCKGFTEFRENLQDSSAISLLEMLCDRVEQVGWRELAKELEAT